MSIKNEVIIKEYLGNGIEFRLIDGLIYVNATSIAKAFENGSQKLKDWKRSKKTQELIEALNEINKINDVEKSHNETINLIISEKGGNDGGGATWIYEKLVLDFCRYLSITFSIWINEQLSTLIRERKQVKSILNALENIEFKGNIDNLVYSKNGKPITTSKIIAEYTGKQHTHILRDIKEEIEKLEKINPNLDTSIIINDFTKTEYLDSYGRSQVNYELGEMATMQLLLKYSAEHRAKFIIMFMEMKNTLMNMFKVKLLEEVLPQDNRLRQYVYIIENCDTSRIKIGVGQDPENRIKQLQTGSDSELSLVYRSNLCSNAFEVEKFMHDNFNDYHIRGEWFEVDKTLVINELERQNFVLKSEFIKELGLKDTIFDNFNIQNV